VRLRLALIGFAIGLAVVPLPADTIERWYSSSIYPVLQRALTSLSNLAPFALLDALLLVLIALAAWSIGRDIHSRRTWGRAALDALLRLGSIAALVYVAFVLVWGLNYRRPSLASRLERTSVPPGADAARRLGLLAVEELNGGYAAAHATSGSRPGASDRELAAAFHQTLALLRLPDRVVPGRPKYTLLDPYFRAASVAGMTDPFFLETLVASDLLAVEQPHIIAHEWSHLAGMTDEGEANFVGWLTGVRGPAPARYSAWLFMYGEILSSVGREARLDISRRLDSGPRDDLRAIAERQRRNVRPLIANAGWQVYDRYLKANRVEAGAASYRQVVQLVLETRFAPEWTPMLDWGR
jgi:hypothetical protein